jgi:oligopeptide transport system substrate-binding protein
MAVRQASPAELGMDVPDGNLLNRRTVLAGAGIVLAAAGTAFTLRDPGSADAAALADSRTFRRGNSAEPDSLDPHLASTQYEGNIVGDMFLGLMTEDARGNPMPGAALAYSASDDGLVYTFTLRDHVWSDGRPVCADDYVYAFRRVLDPKTASPYAAMLYPVRNGEAVNAGHMSPAALGARALDCRTLEVTFHQQIPFMTQLFTHYSTFAVPRHVVERHGDEWISPRNVVTNGAYVLKEWVPNDHILLARNPRFYDARNVAIERVYYYPTADYSAALTRFRAGEIDTQTGVPSQEIDWLRYNLPAALKISPYIATEYVLFNLGQKPFDDPRLRRALSLALNREVIAERIMRAGEQPAYSFVPPHLPGYGGHAQLDFRAMPMAARAAEARALIRAAGYGPDNPFTFDFNIADTSDARLVSVALQAMWETVGAFARIQASDEKNHYNLLTKRDFSVAWAGWVADYRDARDYLFLCESSSHDLNNGAYSNPRYDALLARSDNERDPARRSALLEQAEQIMLDDVALTPIYHQVSRNLVAPSVRNWIPNDISINRTRFLALDRGSV